MGFGGVVGGRAPKPAAAHCKAVSSPRAVEDQGSFCLLSENIPEDGASICDSNTFMYTRITHTTWGRLWAHPLGSSGSCGWGLTEGIIHVMVMETGAQGMTGDILY